MARSFWKGKYLLKGLLQPSYRIARYKHFTPSSNSEEFELENSVLLYRRNQILNTSMMPFFDKIDFQLYNGYNFYKKKLLPEYGDFNLNLAALVQTREHQVTHKVKVSKAQRKLQQTIKKKSTLSGKSKKIKKSVKKKK